MHITDVNEAPVSVEVTALPSNPPAGVTVTTQGPNGCTVTVPENLLPGQVVASISATDLDVNAGNPVCYVQDSNGHFTQDDTHVSDLHRSILFTR